MHPTQKTIDMLRSVAERISKLTARKQFDDYVFNKPVERKVVKEIHNKRGSVKPKGNKIRKRPVGKHAQHDQSTHGQRGGVAPLEGPESYESRKPSGTRPFRSKPTWELRAMNRALTSMPMMNSAEENQRAADVAEELKSRRKQKVTKRIVGKHGSHDQRTHGRRGPETGGPPAEYGSKEHISTYEKPGRRVSNRDVGQFVDSETPFRANNMQGKRNQHGDYAIYSYGSHFPMYAKIKGQWYGNKDKYSSTTSRHQSQARPSGSIRYMSTEKLKSILDRYKKLQRMTKRNLIKHPGHPDQRVHGRRRLAATAAAGAAGAVGGRAAVSAARGLAATAAAGRAVSGLSRTLERLNPKAARKFKRLKRRATRTLRRHKAKLARRLAPAARAGLRLASRAKVPGAIGIGLMAAAAGYGLISRRLAQKVQKAGNLTSGDHVLVLGDEAIVGVYTGNETVRVLTNDSYVDIKPPKTDVLLIQRGNTVPNENSDSNEIETLADTLSRERQVMGRLAEKVKNEKVSKRGVDKHAMGQHDQRSHGNRATRAVRAVRAGARRAGRRVESGIRQAGRAVHATAETTRQVANDLDSVLQGLEAGTRIYEKVKELKDSLMSEAQKMAKVEHIQFINNSMEKGIGHSLEILTNAMKLIRGQEANAKLSEADEKKLQDIIDDIQGMVGYLKNVKEQGHFEKGEAPVPDSTATYRPSFTTPAVARHQKRQRIAPNAKGRGESTARAAGY